MEFYNLSQKDRRRWVLFTCPKLVLDTVIDVLVKPIFLSNNETKVESKKGEE